MMTLLFVVQIVVLMFVLLVVNLLANTNDTTVGPKHSQQKPLMIGTVSSA
jgi:heme/copper-type cytochrome/quinol oxidase subunit 2